RPDARRACTLIPILNAGNPYFQELDMTTELLSDLQGHVLTLTMNRPDKHNALNTALTDALLQALRAAAGNPEVRAIVLTGAGRSFCAGADTGEFSALTPDSPDSVQDRADLTTALHLAFSQ